VRQPANLKVVDLWPWWEILFLSVDHSAPPRQFEDGLLVGLAFRSPLCSGPFATLEEILLDQAVRTTHGKAHA
jgi:hypothetical protein